MPATSSTSATGRLSSGSREGAPTVLAAQSPLSRDLVADVQAVLFSESPDPSALESRLTSSLGLSAAEARSLIDYSGEETDLNIVHFGGEPTLNFSAIRAATEYVERQAAQRGKSVRFDM